MTGVLQQGWRLLTQHKKAIFFLYLANLMVAGLLLVPFMETSGELKTKPTQHSVRELRAIGIQPDILLCRTAHLLPKEIKSKIALFCNVPAEAVVTAKDVENIYEVPLVLHQEALDSMICKLLDLPEDGCDLTAWEGLVEGANVGPGDTVLVHGGAGGVGHVATQIAIARGAQVYATVSGPEKAAAVAEFGATPINYRENSVEDYVAAHTDGAGFDIVYDTVGGENIPKCWAAAKLRGTVISCQTNSTHDLTPLHLKGLQHIGVLMLIPLLHGVGTAAHGEIMREITALAEAGQIRPLLDGEPYSLEDVAAAHARLESGQAMGKVVVRVSG